MSAPPADAPTAPLLTVTWNDLSALSLAPGEAATAEQALSDLLLQQWTDAWRGQIDDLLAQHPDTADPYDLETSTTLADETAKVAGDRLTAYDASLRRYLATAPDEEALAQWIADRAMSDAGVWARGDALDMRQRAKDAFYAHNPAARGGKKWTILPESAAEPRCRDVAGRVYDSYADASDALASVIHRNCIHSVYPAEE